MTNDKEQLGKELTEEELNKALEQFAPLDEEELHAMDAFMTRHDRDCMDLVCPKCSCKYLIIRADATYHNHPPMGVCLEEIYECEECGAYVQVIYRMSDVRLLEAM